MALAYLTAISSSKERTSLGGVKTLISFSFVNAGDPEGFATLKNMRWDSWDNIYGMDELLLLDVGKGLGCDGLFLDTIDTAAPDSYVRLVGRACVTQILTLAPRPIRRHQIRALYAAAKENSFFFYFFFTSSAHFPVRVDCCCWLP